MASDNITSFEKCCRTCLKEDSLMFNIFMERLDSTTLEEMLLSCTKLKIQNNDTLPKEICRYCYNCLVSFNHFCNLAQKAEEKLIEALTNSDGYHHNNFEGDTLDVKIENIYDDIFETNDDNFENVDVSKNVVTPNTNLQDTNFRSKSENKLNCIYCNKYYSNLCKLKNHEEKHKNGLNSEYKDCMETESNEYDMFLIENGSNPESDVKIESNDTDLTCTSSFDSMDSLPAHLKSHNESIMTCNQCNKVFKKVSHLKRHKMTHNDIYSDIDLDEKFNANTKTNSDKFQCDKCLQTFKKINSLSAHMKRHMEKDGVLSCKDCNQVFKNICHLKRHELQHDINPYKCTDCPKTYPSEDALINHTNTHKGVISTSKENLNSNISETNSDQFKCDKCLQMFRNINSLSAHMRKHTENGRVLSCKVCNKIFKKVSHLKRHELQHDINPYKCTDCPKTYPSEDALINHTNTHKGVISTSKENLNSNISETNSDQFKCDKCLQMFRNINSLSAHMRKHTEKGRVLSCKVCNKVFKKVSHLKRHEIQHETNRPYKCTVCQKSFASEDTLKDHAIYHRGIKPHGCPVCKKKFAHLTSLNTHIKIHTREKTFLCPTCGKRFESSTNLNQHILRHMGVRNFACALCPKRFISKGELKSHTTIHTGKKSFACDQCGAMFTKRSSLSRHENRHLGLKPYQCNTCLMRFTCGDHLKRHRRIHTGEKPYKCEMCGRAFTQSNDLDKHRRAHLGDNIYKCSQCPESFRLKTELRHHISEHFILSQKAQAVNADIRMKDDVCDQITEGVGDDTSDGVSDQKIDGVDDQRIGGVDEQMTDCIADQSTDGISKKCLVLPMLKVESVARKSNQ